MEQAYEVLKAARRARGMTQSALAVQVGCKQSAVSMYEAGRVDALSADTVARIAGLLNVDLKALQTSSSGAKKTVPKRLLYCPVDTCPSNIPYLVRGAICLRPRFLESIADSPRCRDCGEVLEESCPNPPCGAKVSEGAFCPSCGSAYVTSSIADGLATLDWVEARQKQIERMRRLSDSQCETGGTR
jgi:transcriptional regulator with XRE-family HTH domain